MNANLETRFFLGANAPGGFASLYDGFTDPRKDTLYIVKGGPGCGKSTFMRTIAQSVRDAGHSVEYIHCSGDPDSLDGVYFPKLAVGYVDGTAPHVIEPSYHGASGIYVDLGGCCDGDALRGKRDAILRLTDAYRVYYGKAYKLIRAAVDTADALSPALPEEALRTAYSRARGIILRELKGQGKNGVTKKRFLSALTCRGPVCFFDTAEALAERIYLLDNDLGLGTHMVELIAAAAEERELDVIRCQSPLRPEHTEHLIIPSLELAFLTRTARFPYKGQPARHLRLDAVPARSELAALRAEQRAAARLSDPLLAEAETCLAKAKSLHDRLEEVYNPHVHFDQVKELAEHHAAALIG